MIKQLSFADAKFMAELHAQGFDNPWPQSDFENHIDNPLDIALGCFDDKNLCGFIIVRAQQDQAEILTIVIGEKYRSQGLARKLLENTEQHLTSQGVEILFLEVAKDNTSALHLYKNTGYQSCGTRPGYYRRNHGRVDAILFQKHLKLAY